MTDVRFTPRRRPALDASSGIAAALAIIGADATRRVPVGDSSFAGSGDLRASQVRKVQGNRGGIGYTDRAAVPAHERLDLRPGNGERKFLESAINENKDAALGAIATSLRRGLS